MSFACVSTIDYSVLNRNEKSSCQTNSLYMRDYVTVLAYVTNALLWHARYCTLSVGLCAIIFAVNIQQGKKLTLNNYLPK